MRSIVSEFLLCALRAGVISGRSLFYAYFRFLRGLCCIEKRWRLWYIVTDDISRYVATHEPEEVSRRTRLLLPLFLSLLFPSAPPTQEATSAPFRAQPSFMRGHARSSRLDTARRVDTQGKVLSRPSIDGDSVPFMQVTSFMRFA